MIKLGEYLPAMVMLIVAGIAAVSKISHWNGTRAKPAIKLVGYIMVCVVFIYVADVVT
jgi:hypothetical protein